MIVVVVMNTKTLTDRNSLYSALPTKDYSFVHTFPEDVCDYKDLDSVVYSVLDQARTSPYTNTLIITHSEAVWMMIAVALLRCHIRVQETYAYYSDQNLLYPISILPDGQIDYLPIKMFYQERMYRQMLIKALQDQLLDKISKTI